MIIIYGIILFIVFSTLYSLIGKIRGKANGCVSSFLILILSFIIIESVYNNFIKDADNINKNTNNELIQTTDNYSTTNKTNFSKNSYNVNNNLKYIESNTSETYETSPELDYYVDDDSDYYDDNNLHIYIEDNNSNENNYYYSNQNLNIKPKVRVGAVCNDGTISTATGRGACSHHGGVAYWLYE